MPTIGFNDLGYAGRLGNQLWQIASTIGIGDLRGDPAHVGSHGKRWDYEGVFSIPEHYLDPPHSFISSYMTPETTHLDVRAGVYLQDRHLWWHLKDKIYEYFQPSRAAQVILRHHELYGRISAYPHAAIHVRRTDYVTNPPGTLNALSWGYYDRAMRELPDDVSCVVFTDDPEWCADRFPNTPIVSGSQRPPDSAPEDYWASRPDDWVDLALMAKCTHHIIANSAYSWWGAFLSDDPSPIYPSVWCGFDYINTSLMFPIGWRKVDAALVE